jgi:hypothetical protein
MEPKMKTSLDLKLNTTNQDLNDGLLIFSRKTQDLLYQWKYPAAHKKPWKKPYTNILAYQDLWILADGHGEIWGLRPLY